MVETPTFNILEHDLVPTHIILSADEVKHVLEEYNITITQLPKILTTDPVVKALEANEGDVLKIIRQSVVAGIATYYRLVIKK